MVLLAKESEVYYCYACDINRNILTIKEIIENVRREAEQILKNHIENFNTETMPPEIKFSPDEMKIEM